MGRYTVITGQNLYDVALDIYGSIEGITDLLVSNPRLSMAAELHAGDQLDYSDDYLVNAETAAYLRREGITPASGERRVYFRQTSQPRRLELCLPAATSGVFFSLSGRGMAEIDWGDNAPLQTVGLEVQPAILRHTFDNSVATTRIVRLYGDIELREADLSDLAAQELLLLRPLHVEELALRRWRAPLSFLPLMEGLYALDLRDAVCDDLRPLIECRNLMRLDLSGAEVQRQVLDGWLTDLVRRHYGRRACHVTLSVRPSGEYREPARDEELNYILSCGMEAVWLLTHEEAWNEGAPWRFTICGEEYVYEAVPEPEEPEPEPEPEPGLTPPPHSGGAND